MKGLRRETEYRAMDNYLEALGLTSQVVAESS